MTSDVIYVNVVELTGRFNIRFVYTQQETSVITS